MKKYFIAKESATGVFPVLMSGQNINLVLKICFIFLECSNWMVGSSWRQ